MIRALESVLALLLVGTSAYAQVRDHPAEMRERLACLDRFNFIEVGRSVVNIYIEQPGEILDTSGTGWFIDDMHIVTIGHVADSFPAGDGEQVITLGRGTIFGEPPAMRAEVTVRTVKTLETGTGETIAILQIQEAIQGERFKIAEDLDLAFPQVRFTPPKRNEVVLGIAYPGQEMLLTYAVGHFRPPEQSNSTQPSKEQPKPWLMFELMDREAKVRLLFDYGASGAPIFDCDGKVLAVTSNAITQMIDFGPAFPNMRVSTPWGMANNFGVFSSQLGESLE